MTEPIIAHAVKEVLVARVVYGLRSQGSLLPVLILSTGRRENLGTRLFARLYLARCNSEIKGKKHLFDPLDPCASCHPKFTFQKIHLCVKTLGADISRVTFPKFFT